MPRVGTHSGQMHAAYMSEHMHVLPSVTTEIKPDAADHALFPTALAVLKHICGQTTEFARSIVVHVTLECAFHVVYAVLESAFHALLPTAQVAGAALHTQVERAKEYAGSRGEGAAAHMEHARARAQGCV